MVVQRVPLMVAQRVPLMAATSVDLLDWLFDCLLVDLLAYLSVGKMA